MGSKGGVGLGIPGIGKGGGGTRRKLPAERTLLNPGAWVWVWDVCEDVDEWEDDELGFRCTDVGIDIGSLLGVAVGVRSDEAVIEVEDFRL